MQSNTNHLAAETASNLVTSDFYGRQSRELRFVVGFENFLHPLRRDRGRIAIRRQWYADNVAYLALDSIEAIEQGSLGQGPVVEPSCAESG